MTQTPNPSEYRGHTVRPQSTKVKGTVYQRYAVDFGMVHGKRHRRTFKSELAAKAAIREWLDKQKSNEEARAKLAVRIGEKAERLSTDDLLDAAKALDTLEGCTTLKQAADFYMEHTHPAGAKHTARELYDAYVQSREKAGRRTETIRDIRVCLGPYADAFGDTPVSHVTIDDLDRWIDEQNGGASRRNKRRRHLVGMFNFAIKRRWREDNPASNLETANTNRARPYVMPVEDVEAVMRYTVENESEMVPYMALCLFAGIRPHGEMERLDWRDISLERCEIYVSDEVSKTGDDRYVKMTDNLVRWIRPHKRQSGPVFHSRRVFDRIRSKAGVRWAQDCMRHSFASYHLAMWQKRGETAEQMGHTNMRILAKHYRRAVRQEDAAKFWSIAPAKQASVIQFSAKTA